MYISFIHFFHTRIIIILLELYLFYSVIISYEIIHSLSVRAYIIYEYIIILVTSFTRSEHYNIGIVYTSKYYFISSNIAIYSCEFFQNIGKLGKYPIHGLYYYVYSVVTCSLNKFHESEKQYIRAYIIIRMRPITAKVALGHLCVRTYIYCSYLSISNNRTYGLHPCYIPIINIICNTLII